MRLGNEQLRETIILAPEVLETTTTLFLVIQWLSNLRWAQQGSVSSGVPRGHAGVCRDLANYLGLDGHKSGD